MLILPKFRKKQKKISPKSDCDWSFASFEAIAENYETVRDVVVFDKGYLKKKRRLSDTLIEIAVTPEEPPMAKNKMFDKVCSPSSKILFTTSRLLVL